MHKFLYRENELFCEDVKLAELARDFDTPLYVYSKDTLKRHYDVFNEAFSGVPHIICFACKANSSLGILNTLSALGSGADIVSGGELYLAQKAKIPASKIVYSGVGKKKDEMEMALKVGILMFNIESFQELAALDEVAGEMGVKAPISLRVNPDVDPKTHPYVATGLATSKFGISFDEAIGGYLRAFKMKNIEVIGVDCHIGSQLTDVGPFVDAIRKLKDLVSELRLAGMKIKYLDLGGGLGITYDKEAPPSPAEYAKAIKSELSGLDITVIAEPGRNIAGNAGILLSRVLYTKKALSRKFVIVDAGMNDLARPSLYGSYHGVLPVIDKNAPKETVDVVGPICESGDFIARDRELPQLGQGDLVAVMSAGAYGFTMSSTYNARPQCAEILVDKSKVELIRKRGTYEDLILNETVL